MPLFLCKLTDLTLSRCLSMASICPHPHPALWAEGPRLEALWQAPNRVESLAAVTTAQVQARTLSFSVPSLVLLPLTSIPSSTAETLSQATSLDPPHFAKPIIGSVSHLNKTQSSHQPADPRVTVFYRLLTLFPALPPAWQCPVLPLSTALSSLLGRPSLLQRLWEDSSALPEVCWVAPEGPLLHDLVSLWYCQQFTIFVSVLTSGNELKYQLTGQEKAPVLFLLHPMSG